MLAARGSDRLLCHGAGAGSVRGERRMCCGETSEFLETLVRSSGVLSLLPLPIPVLLPLLQPFPLSLLVCFFDDVVWAYVI